MCGRFTLTRPDIAELAREFGAEVAAETVHSYRARWNIAPTNTHPVLKAEGGVTRLVPARFGVHGPGGRFVINARSETAAELRTFRDAFHGARCVVPADGFFEWQGGRGDRRPVWFHDPAGALLLFAGLAFEGPDGLAFVIVTTPANGLVSPFHDRMPALLSHAGARTWLSRPDHTLLAPAPDGFLTVRDVSLLVNDVANDGPELLGPPAPKRQLSLV
jgi:putative SOS response-associated peptidase YedK